MNGNNPLSSGSLSSIAKMAVKKPVSEGERSFMPLNKLKADPNQPRKEFDPVYIQELSDSIREHGVLKSIRVSRQPDPADGLHIIHMGECRYRASLLAGKEDIPYEFDDNYDPYAQVVENEKQRPLRPHEMALFIKARKAEGHTYAFMAQKLTTKENRVAKLAALIDWPAYIEQVYHNGMTADVETLYMLVTLNKEYPAEVEVLCKKASSPEEIGRSAVKALKARLQAAAVAAAANEETAQSAAQNGQQGAAEAATNSQPSPLAAAQSTEHVQPSASTGDKEEKTPKWLEEQRKRDAALAEQKGAAQQAAPPAIQVSQPVKPEAAEATQQGSTPTAHSGQQLLSNATETNEEPQAGPRVLVKVMGKEAYLLLDASCDFGFVRVAYTTGIEEEVLAEDLEVLAIV